MFPFNQQSAVEKLLVLKILEIKYSIRTYFTLNPYCLLLAMLIENFSCGCSTLCNIVAFCLTNRTCKEKKFVRGLARASILLVVETRKEKKLKTKIDY